MGRRAWLLALALALAAGCSHPNAPAVSPGDEMEVYDAGKSEVLGWRDAELMGRRRHELIEIAVGTRVRLVDSGRVVADRPHEMVRILEGPDRDVTAYLPRENLRPLPAR